MASEEKASSSPSLSPAEVAVELGVSAASVRRWIAAGELQAVKLGDRDLARILISRSDLDAFVRPAHATSDETVMNLRTLRAGKFGVSEPVRDDNKELRQARVSEARRYWQELPTERLRPRGPGWLVDAETDLLYAPHRGVTFERGSARLIADQAELSFTLDPEGWPVALERLNGTWSAIVEMQARR